MVKTRTSLFKDKVLDLQIRAYKLKNLRYKESY